MERTENRSERIALMMTSAEVRALDDVRFAKRLNSRAEAIRLLVDAGMKTLAASEAPAA